jgi:hypothetical protein
MTEVRTHDGWTGGDSKNIASATESQSDGVEMTISEQRRGDDNDRDDMDQLTN